MNIWSAFWLAWLGLFVVLESIALFDGVPGNTLSEKAWAWGSFKAKGRAWRLRRLAFLVLLAWLLVHIATGGWI